MFSYRRWRHTRGHGVHSPYAYDLVSYVVRPGRAYSFYGYSDIDATAGSPGFSMKVRREARMFLRLLAFTRADSVYIPLGVHSAYHAAAYSIGKKLRIERKPRNASSCTVLTSHGEFIPLQALCDHLLTPGHIVALRSVPEGWTEKLFEALPGGVMIYSRQNTVVICRDKMQKVAYEMKI